MIISLYFTCKMNELNICIPISRQNKYFVSGCFNVYSYATGTVVSYLETYWFSEDLTQERIIYNCLWEKHSFLRSMPTIEKVYPWDLFIVRENDIFTGGFNHLKDIGKSVYIIGIREMRVTCPVVGPVMIVVTITESHCLVICLSKVLCYTYWLKFLKGIIGIPTFNFSSWGGKPVRLRKFKNSCGYCTVTGVSF